MLRSPLLRRVSIYLLLSSGAVAAVNRIDPPQDSLYQIYIPLFIGIYILSRWIDSKVGQSQGSTSNPVVDESPSARDNDNGFGR